MKKFELYYPLKEFVISQPFGSTAFLSFYKENDVVLSGHNGVDYVVKHGTPIRASHAGTAYYEVDSKQGHGVVIRTDEEYEYGEGTAFFKTIYWHLCDPVKEPQFKSPIWGATPSKGIKVNIGDIIGYVNTTGLSTGDHLHYGLKPCALGEPHNTWYNLAQNNGMYGAIDPTPYFVQKFAEDYVAPPVKQKHYFDKSIYIGDTSDEVKILQSCLQYLGYFPATLKPTGYYGRITKEAVYKFQLKYVSTTWQRSLEVWFNRGDAVLSKTRYELNKIFSV